MLSAVICSSVTQDGGRAWSTASQYHSCILLQALGGRGGSLVSRLSTSSPAIVTRRRLSAFRYSQMDFPNSLIYQQSLLGYLLVETLSSTSIHVSNEIHELWHAARLSGFGTARQNSENSLSDRVLV